MEKSTQELYEILKNTNDLDDFFAKNAEVTEPAQVPHVLEQALAKCGKKKSVVIARAGIERHYGYQIFSGLKTPSRDKLLMLCIGMELTPDEAQALLKSCGVSPLHAKDKRDSAVIFALQKGLDTVALNELLFNFSLPLFE